MNEQMDATKDSTSEPTSPNPIQSVAEFVRKTLDHSKHPHVFGSGLPRICCSHRLRYCCNNN